MGTRGAIDRQTGGEPTVTHVASRDGTRIAYWTSGDGPPLVLVHGAPADHTRWGPLLPHLEPHVTVHAVDRRGRGASGDAPDYHIDREFEDLAAVVDAVAEASGSAVDVYGHSFGGLVAFGGAALTPNIRRLVLYEGWPLVDADAFVIPPGVAAQLDGLLAEGDRDVFLETFFREVVMVSEEELGAMRAMPSWQARAAAAPALPRELRVVTEALFDPAQAAKITVPVLMLAGSDSRDPAAREIEVVASALPDARIGILEGQEHVADVMAPHLVAEQLLAFLRAPV